MKFTFYYLMITSTLLAVNAYAQNEPWEYYKLAIHWPNGFCSTGRRVCNEPKVRELGGIWTIRGLWPTKNDDDSAKGNRGEEFTRQAIGKEIDSKITPVWPSLTFSQEFLVWRHEYEEHGIVTGHPPLQYLEDTYQAFMEVFKIGDIGTILAEANITPGAFYDETDIYDALRKRLNVKVQLNCKPDSLGKTDGNGNLIYHLLEVYVCLNKALGLTDCIERSYCGDTSRLFYADVITPRPSPPPSR